MLIITQSEYILKILNELSYVSDFTTMIEKSPAQVKKVTVEDVTSLS